MEKDKYSRILGILKEQLVLASGCTEPIAIAYAASVARSYLGQFPDSIEATVSSCIIKNAKSVVVPGTSGMKGIEVAVAAGIVIGNEKRKLEVLADAPSDTKDRIIAFLDKVPINVAVSKSGLLFDIDLILKASIHTVRIRIASSHTNIVLIEKDGDVLFQKDVLSDDLPDDDLSFSDLFTFVNECKMQDVSSVILNQIECNKKLSDEGLQGHWGAEIGRNLMESDYTDVLRRAKAKAAAGSDARMSGCILPAVINSGSGNQGLTVSLPVYEFAKALKCSEEEMIRAVVLSNLVAIYIKQSIGCLSAYCGAVSAGCGSGAGIAYLHHMDYSQIAQTVINGLAILSGTICDGAKPSCAAKVAMAVEAGYLGFRMVQNGDNFNPGDGIVKKSIDETIKQIGILSREGLSHTNDVILQIMLGK